MDHGTGTPALRRLATALAATTLLLTAGTSPAQSRPVLDVDRSSATRSTTTTSLFPYCFMGRPGWPDDMVLPPCRR